MANIPIGSDIKSKLISFDLSDLKFRKVRKKKSMDMSTTSAIRDELLKNNQNFRELVQKHQNYEERLDELQHLSYPSEEELLEETTIKKKKLLLKDEIYAMMQKYDSH